MKSSTNTQERYSRQIILPEIGKLGQKKLAQKTVAIIGIGALGTVSSELLARAGIGNLILIDRDVIEESNLQRQVLFNENDIGQSKALAAKEKLQKINSAITIEAHPIHLQSANIKMLGNVDLILDCTDNMKTRFLMNDFCKKEKIPWIYSGAIGLKGVIFPILPNSPCLRCCGGIQSQETCDTAGVLNMTTAIIASFQCVLAIKILLGLKIKPLLSRINSWNLEIENIKVKKNKFCPACNGNFSSLEQKESLSVLQFCGSARYQIMNNNLNPQELKKRWKKIGKVREDRGILKFKNIILFSDGRALIKASSEREAQSTYSKYVGN